MSKLTTLKKLWSNNRRLIVIAVFNNINHTGLFRCLSDKRFISLAYYINTGKRMNWRSPQTFTQKLQWLKIHDRTPKFTKMVDKISAKEYVASTIGEEYVIPTLGVWNSFDEIDFALLPDQFVLKTNNGSGSNGVVVCKDKSSFDKKTARELLNSSLSSNTYELLREWPYKNIAPKLFAEEFITDNSAEEEKADLTDYKFFCFNGVPSYCQVIKDRSSKETIDFFDSNWEHQPFIGLNPQAVSSTTPIQKPAMYFKMLSIARTLSEGLPFARIDLYQTGKKIYFGEITFYPASGFGRFSPDEYDRILGDMIKLPNY